MRQRKTVTVESNLTEVIHDISDFISVVHLFFLQSFIMPCKAACRNWLEPVRSMLFHVQHVTRSTACDNIIQYPNVFPAMRSRFIRVFFALLCIAMHCNVTFFTSNLRSYWILMDSHGFLQYLCAAINSYPKKYWSYRIRHCHISLHSKAEKQPRYGLCATSCNNNNIMKMQYEYNVF